MGADHDDQPPWLSVGGVGVGERQGDVVPPEPERIIESSQITVGQVGRMGDDVDFQVLFEMLDIDGARHLALQQGHHCCEGFQRSSSTQQVSRH